MLVNVYSEMEIAIGGLARTQYTRDGERLCL
jgi:hypothetical protein